jgi:MATE family multidrug resistance protein
MFILNNNIKKQYSTKGGYKEFLKIAIPLSISMGIGSIQLFTDRLFLSWHSAEAFAASTPAGVINWVIEVFFIGSLSYVDVFVAQYYGKKEYRSIGPSIWQSVYLTFVASVLILAISFFSELLFMHVGHLDSIACEEVKFFKMLCYGAFPCIAGSTLSSFYIGRGETKFVFLLSLLAVITNISLDYCLIFGHFGFPEFGITGAALATNISFTIICIIYVALIMSKKNRNTYNTAHLKPNFLFMKRLLKYGIPSGVEFFFDTIGFGIFILIIGNMGIKELAASNIVATINHIFMMPVVGIGTTVSIMVGNYLGKNKSELAKLSVKSALHITYTYMIFIIILLIFFHRQLIYPFSWNVQPELVQQVEPMVINLLIILSIYSIFYCANVIFACAIKGAGDTLFVMKRLLLCSIFIIIIPSYFNVIIFKNSLYLVWGFFILYFAILACSFYFRYKSNKWQKIRVIEAN